MGGVEGDFNGGTRIRAEQLPFLTHDDVGRRRHFESFKNDRFVILSQQEAGVLCANVKNKGLYIVQIGKVKGDLSKPEKTDLRPLAA